MVITQNPNNRFKMNHTEQNVLLFATWFGTTLGFMFTHAKEFSLLLSFVATAPIIYERYKPIIARVWLWITRVWSQVITVINKLKR